MIFVIQFHRLGLAREGDTGRGVGGGVKETFYAVTLSPSLLPSWLAGFHPGGWGRRRNQRNPKLGPVSTSETCTCLERVPQSPQAQLWGKILLHFGNNHGLSRDQRRPSEKDLSSTDTSPATRFYVEGKRDPRERDVRGHTTDRDSLRTSAQVIPPHPNLTRGGGKRS